MTEKLLLTFNTGSSTVKIGLFAVEARAAQRLGKGMIDFRSQPLTFHLVEGPQTFDVPLKAAAGDELHDVMQEVFGWLDAHFRMETVAAAGHRVVHGGERFVGPVLLDDEAVAGIAELVPLAPLHQPQSLKLIEAIRHLRPDMAQSASFDTAFHHSQDPLAQRFAIPRALHDEGIRRYGFHGLSYKYISGEILRRAPSYGRGRIVAAHLGSGASLCAMENGKSRDTSMGFSTLDGIPMATRCGALDPGVVLHLAGQKNMSIQELEDILYHRSGLLGVSGISPDSRVLLESRASEAQEALALFAFRTAGEIARLATSLGGLDGLVFTAGVGEHQPRVRAAICERLAWLGLELDVSANATNADVISAGSSRVGVFVIPTDEEQVIADEAASVLFS